MKHQKFIHEANDWPNFTWDAGIVSEILEKVSHHIGVMAGRLKYIGFEGLMQTTMESVTYDIVASSEIEGVSLNTDEVRSSVARRLGISIKDEKEPTHYVEGIVSMMMDAVMKFDTPLTHERLYGWHAALFPNGYSGIDKICVGKYRSEGMKVISGAIGREQVHYVAPAPERLKEEMERFLNWFNDEDKQPATLIKSAIAHLWFVCIHPFDDGNGRISRALSDMVLSQTDGSRFRYFSISREICRDKRHYYDILERTTSHDSCEITEWVVWYLKCIDNAVTESESLLSTVLSKTTFWQCHSKKVLTERQQHGLNIFLDGYEAKITAKNWARLLDVSTDTALRDIRELVEKQILKPVKGRVRDVCYNIVYSNEEKLLACLTKIKLSHTEKDTYITATFNALQTVSERISTLDFQRYEQGELDLNSLATKYFAYLG